MEPPQNYASEGTPQKPVVMCLSLQGRHCYQSFVAHVVSCGDHYLWRLPTLPACPAFCAMEPSGLPHANDIASTD